jgi:probable rRNA maturation factor
VLDEMHMHPLAELSVLLVDSATMADLHQRWLGEPGPTDVLAFPMDELRPPPPGSDRADRAGTSDPGSAPGLLGDVVLCPEVAAGQAREATHKVSDELELLCTHGILHLLGFDHADPGERATMFGLQDRLLASWRAAHGAPADALAADGGPAAGDGSAADGAAGTGAGGTGAGRNGAPGEALEAGGDVQERDGSR